MKKLYLFNILIFLNFKLTRQYSSIPSFFNNWHCIGISEKINFKSPYKANIGELPLVIWKNPKTNNLLSTINICKHMGSKLDN